MGGHFAVSLRTQRNTGIDEFLAEFGKVLNNPVVDDRDFSVGRHVRVGIAISGTTVGGPAGVTDPGVGHRRGLVFEFTLEDLNLAGPLASPQVLIRDQRHSGRVVAPIFQPAQSSHHNVEGCSIANVSDDSAHEGKPRAKGSR